MDAKATQPDNSFLHAGGVSGLSGIYEYQCQSHSLKRLDSQVPKAMIQETGIGDQPWLSEAAIVIGVAAELKIRLGVGSRVID